MAVKSIKSGRVVKHSLIENNFLFDVVLLLYAYKFIRFDDLSTFILFLVTTANNTGVHISTVHSTYMYMCKLKTGTGNT